MKSILTLTLVFGFWFSATASCAVSSRPLNECDTILTTEGKMYLCQVLSRENNETLFSLCGDTMRTVYSIPNHRIASFKKGRKIIEEKPAPPVHKLQKKPALRQKITKTDTSRTSRIPTIENLEDRASGALIMGCFSLLFSVTLLFSPIGLILGIVAASKGDKVAMIAQSLPNNKRAMRRAKWAMLLGTLGVVISTAVVVWVIHVVTSWKFDLQ